MMVKMKKNTFCASLYKILPSVLLEGSTVDACGVIVLTPWLLQPRKDKLYHFLLFYIVFNRLRKTTVFNTFSIWLFQVRLYKHCQFYLCSHRWRNSSRLYPTIYPSSKWKNRLVYDSWTNQREQGNQSWCMFIRLIFWGFYNTPLYLKVVRFSPQRTSSIWSWMTV